MTDERAGAWSGAWWLSTRWLRRRALATVPILLIVAAGTAGASIALSTADRTANTYGDYLRRADVGDVVINPSVSTREIDQVIRTLPGVEQVTSDTVFVTTLDDGRPRTREDIESTGLDLFVHGSTDGRFTEMDRPAVQAGRMPTGDGEAVLNVDGAAAQQLAIGDRVSIAFWQPGLSDEGPGPAQTEYAREVIDPIGVEEVEIVGIVTLPGQVLPDELFPRGDMILSPELADRYDCLPAMPAPGGTFAVALATLLPDDCALSYRYYSVGFSDGAAGVKPALDDFVTRAAPLNEILVQISDLDELAIDPPSHFLIPTESALEAKRVDRAVQPMVAALVVLGLAAGIVALVLVGLAVARELRGTQTDQQQWRELAVGRSARALVVGLPAVVAIVIGVLVGAVAAFLLAPGPIGQVDVVDRGTGRRIDLLALVAAGALGTLAIAAVAVLAARSTGSTGSKQAGPTTTRAGRSVPATVGSPAVADGVRAAIGPRAAIPVIAGSALVGGALVAAVIFGSSLAALVSTPSSYGWPWDVAAMTGFGYGDLNTDGVRQLLDDDADVDGWLVLGFLNEASLDDQPTLAVLALGGAGDDLGLTLLSGSIPGFDEIALGASTAAEQGLEVGDTVELGVVFSTTTVTVSGIVVFPSLGPYAADRVGAGTGLLLPEALVRDIAEREPDQGDPLGLATFVGVGLRDDASSDAVTRLSAQLGPLDRYGNPALRYEDPVRPPELVDLSTTRAVPVIVAIVLGAMATVGLLFASWASARSRRRDLAVLRTLGFTGTQVRRSVRAQSAATAALAIVIALPFGVVLGRLLWRQFAGQLGVIPDPAGAWVPLVLVVVGGLVAAVLAAQVPAFLATRGRPAEGLRAE